MANNVLRLMVDSSELDRLAIGSRVYEAFNIFKGEYDARQKAVISHIDEKEIVISENDLLEIIKLVNGHEDVFNYSELHIRLI